VTEGDISIRVITVTFLSVLDNVASPQLVLSVLPAKF